jgi:hypothetical protein
MVFAGSDCASLVASGSGAAGLATLGAGLMVPHSLQRRVPSGLPGVPCRSYPHFRHWSPKIRDSRCFRVLCTMKDRTTQISNRPAANQLGNHTRYTLNVEMPSKPPATEYPNPARLNRSPVVRLKSNMYFVYCCHIAIRRSCCDAQKSPLSPWYRCISTPGARTPWLDSSRKHKVVLVLDPSRHRTIAKSRVAFRSTSQNPSINNVAKRKMPEAYASRPRFQKTRGRNAATRAIPVRRKVVHPKYQIWNIITFRKRTFRLLAPWRSDLATRYPVLPYSVTFLEGFSYENRCKETMPR